MTERDKPDVYVPPGEAPPKDLVVEDVEVGDGDEAKTGQQVEVHYAGNAWSTRKQFDASWDRGSPFSFGYSHPSTYQDLKSGFFGIAIPDPAIIADLRSDQALL